MSKTNYSNKINKLKNSSINKIVKNYKWLYEEENPHFIKTIQLKNYNSDLECIMNYILKISKFLNHHPVININYNLFTIKLNTHDYNDVSTQDYRFIFLLNKFCKHFKNK
jgi:pterin-4a-carbinolamine dehydratase